MALGAGRWRVIADVLRQGLTMTLVGLAIGLAASLALMRLMDAILFGVEPHDPATFAGVATAILTVAILACVVPAYRASRLDPLAVLKEE